MLNFYAWEKARELEEERRARDRRRLVSPPRRGRKVYRTIERGWPPILAEMKTMLEPDTPALPPGSKSRAPRGVS
jgi:hypothetical protein